MRRFIEREVMARQVLNAAAAVPLATESGIDWLVHLDSDELFCVEGGSAPAHFQRLADQGIRRALYLNHEAAPEQEDIEDFFRTVTLFKLNPLAHSATSGAAGGTSVGEAERLALARQRRALFHFYANGKSAATVDPWLRPLGVHEFAPYVRGGPMRGARAAAARMRIARRATRSGHPARRLLRALLGSEGPSVLQSDAFILHYACCGFRAFSEKYRLLGRFDDRWFGRAPIVRKIGTFHLEARDIVLAGDEEAARRFYRSRVLLQDPAEITRLIEGGVLGRFEEPSRLLRIDSGSRRTRHADEPGTLRNPYQPWDR